MDMWTQPFWDATAKGELLVPRCADCGQFRWPPGPFCPHCQSQRVEWRPAGPAYLYTYTIISRRMENDGQNTPVHVPGLVEFPQAGGIVDTPVSTLRIGAELALSWAQTANAAAPVFKIA